MQQRPPDDRMRMRMQMRVWARRSQQGRQLCHLALQVRRRASGVAEPRAGCTRLCALPASPSVGTQDCSTGLLDTVSTGACQGLHTCGTGRHRRWRRWPQLRCPCANGRLFQSCPGRQECTKRSGFRCARDRRLKRKNRASLRGMAHTEDGCARVARWRKQNGKLPKTYAHLARWSCDFHG